MFPFLNWKDLSFLAASLAPLRISLHALMNTISFQFVRKNDCVFGLNSDKKPVCLGGLTKGPEAAN